MPTGLVYDERFLLHDTGPGHPERPDRLRAVVKRLRDEGVWEGLVHLSFAPAETSQMLRVHGAAYVDRLRAACMQGLPFIDESDSAICAESFDIACLAVGGALAAVDAVWEGRVDNAFCALRPPGHHAEADRSMGFCLFNNVAIAARYLMEHHGVARVAIVDFDVHHGNGTQHLFEDCGDVLFVSLHEDPTLLYPGTGHASETGRGPGQGATINLPMRPRSTDDDYLEAFASTVVPALERFGPQVLLVSAGFDASVHDPLAHICVTRSGFRWMAAQLKEAAGRLCQGRLISLLEGGYDLGALAEAVCDHVSVLKDS